jgi:chaperonin cofactor prefoldin
MSLTIRQTQHTFKRYATQLSSIEGELDEMDTVLGAMKRVQLSQEE